MLAPHTKFYRCTLISLVFIYIYVNREARAGERPSRETERRARRRPRARRVERDHLLFFSVLAGRAPRARAARVCSIMSHVLSDF